MKKKLTQAEMQMLLNQARSEFMELSATKCLPGMERSLTEGERQGLAFLHASLTIWNRRGMLVPNWHELIDLELLDENTDPEVE